MNEFITGCLRITLESGFVPFTKLAELLGSFSALYPGITYSIKSQSKIRLRETLIANSANLIFCRADSDEQFAHQIPWMKSSMHLVTGEHRLAGIPKDQQTIETFLSLPIVDTGPSFPLISSLLTENETSVDLLQGKAPQFIARDRQMIESLVRQGLVSALLISSQDSLPQKVRALDHIARPAPVETVMSFRKRESRNLVDSLFIEFFDEQLHQTSA